MAADVSSKKVHDIISVHRNRVQTKKKEEASREKTYHANHDDKYSKEIICPF